MFAVGEHKLPNFNPIYIQMSHGFAGGSAGLLQDLCGAYTAGIMVIGGLYGRKSASKPDTACYQAIKAYRERFTEALGSVNCGELRREVFGSHNNLPCSILVERAANLLLDLIDEHEAHKGKY